MYIALYNVHLSLSVQVVHLRTQVCVVFLVAAEFSLPDHLVSLTVFCPLKANKVSHREQD